MANRPADIDGTRASRKLDRTSLALIAVAAGCAVFTFAVWYPGVLNNDSAQQFQDAVTGRVNDWQPPIMTRLWMAFGPSHGRAPLFALNTGLYWVGFALIAHALNTTDRKLAAWLVLIGAASPLFVFLNRQIITDVGMASALVAAFGVAFAARVQLRSIPPLQVALLVAALLYAALVRTNAIFAVAPILLYAIGFEPKAHLIRWTAVCLVLSVALLPLTIVVNRSVLRATNSGAVQRLQLYDLVGIADQTGDYQAVSQATGVPSPISNGCYSPILWDTLKTPQCAELWYRLAPPGTTERERLGQFWLEQIARHPLAYAVHRLKHFNAETFFLIPPAPQCLSAPQLHDCGRAGGAHSRAFGGLSLSSSDYLLKSALVWPIVWLALGAAALVARRDDGGSLDVASRALLASGLLYGAGFLVVGIAMNVRYFLWTFIAIQTAVLMLLGSDREAGARRFILILAAPTLLVICLGYAARLAGFSELVR